MMNADYVDFTDLEDPNWDAATSVKSKAPSTEEFPCVACAGSGKRTYGYTHITVYPCGVCRGTGKVTAQRLKNIERAKKASATQQENARRGYIEFKRTHQQQFDWLVRNADSFEFAPSLLEQLQTRGKLSEAQMAAIDRCLAREAQRREENAKQRQQASCDVEGAANIMKAFRKAQSNQIKRPKMRFSDVVFSLAPDTGRNAGSIYVTILNEYAGRITDGKFFPTNFGARPESVAKLEPIFADPLKEAIAYGQRSGKCSCCGRELSNHASIDAGIGPVCQSKFF